MRNKIYVCFLLHIFLLLFCFYFFGFIKCDCYHFYYIWPRLPCLYYYVVETNASLNSPSDIYMYIYFSDSLSPNMYIAYTLSLSPSRCLALTLFLASALVLCCKATSIYYPVLLLSFNLPSVRLYLSTYILFSLNLCLYVTMYFL